VVEIFGVEGDKDKEPLSYAEAIERLRAAKLLTLVYTSASPGHFRVLCPTSRPLPPQERTKLLARVNGVLGGALAPESFTLSQSYYYGTVTGRATPQTCIIDGDYIDLRDDLDAGALGKPDKSLAVIVDSGHTGRADANELAEIVSWIPNPQIDWVEWKNMAMRVYASGGREVFPIFQEWSQRCPDYDLVRGPAADRKCWHEVCGSPPDRTGIAKLKKMAREHGWIERAKPSQIGNEISADAARQKTQECIDAFLDGVIKGLNSPWAYYVSLGSGPVPPAPAQGLCTPTGIGKTEMTTKGIAARSERLGVVIYATPTHKLNTRIDDQFIGHGITARVFRGREAADPENKGKQMCLNLEAVELAQEIGAGITETCCKKGEKTCKYIGQCGYYRQQQNAEDVRVWIIAHSMLFHYHRVFGEPVAVIIDEGFWGAGLRGIRKDDKCVLSLSSIDKNTDNIELILRETLSDARETLSDALEQQKDDGGVERQNLLDNRVTAEQCRKAIKLEWSCLPRITIEPGMSKKQIQRLGIDAAAIKHGRRMIRIWREVRDLLEDDAITTSGRLTLLQEEGVRWRG
jgi:hypothetical protein